MGATSAAKGVTQIDNNSAMAGPEQMMKLGDELARLVGESVATLADLPPVGSKSLNEVENWLGRTVWVDAEDGSWAWDGDGWDAVAGTYLGGAATITGSKPSIGAPLKIQTGNQVVTANGSGNFTINLPVPFPNALLTAQMMNGDGANSGAHIVGQSGSLSTINGRLFGGTSVIANATARVYWLAVGW